MSPPQRSIEDDFRGELKDNFEVSFTNLFAITNMPLGRFFDMLDSSGDLEQYLTRLIGAFNPDAVSSVMCKDLISVGWDGTLFDCDFNHMLFLKCAVERPTIWDFDLKSLASRRIVLGLHCYACMAGSGSSCTGEVTGKQGGDCKPSCG
jgi:radical SAM/Cys-rich protein